ncbi:hypothetical protein [Ornithinimicrobium cerasi]|uniref:DUF4878 domain-containing protein n=1 Tax=Ornithinimicrobium cerasi TaxID=2248773 RepID=A0A285VFL3_9MICO|nr:hypothetical protein [Ornithinimicrobium cerasi]SOC52358.1 hypothetical protein SAMN05421879_101506 [Ornithinimicrobium cerasi]
MSRTVIVAAVASLVLAGCTGSTEPSQPPTSEDALTTTSPVTEEAAVTSEAAPTTEEPEETEEPAAFPQTETGAEGFVAYYVETLNGVHVGKQDIKTLRALSEETCQTCQAFADVAEASPFGGPYMQFISGSPVLVGDEAVVETVLEQESDGSTVDSVFTLTWGDDEWRVSKIQAAGR